MGREVVAAPQPPGVDSSVAALKTRLPRTPRRVVRRERLVDRLRQVADVIAALDSTVAGRSGDPDLDLLALAHRGRLLLWREESDGPDGRSGSAERDLTAAVALATAGGHDHLALSCLSHLSVTFGNIRQTGERARAAIAFAEERGWERTPSCALAQSSTAPRTRPSASGSSPCGTS